MQLHIVVCAGIVPDPLQTLEPVMGPKGPALKNEMMLPAVLDPWAASALYEAANLAAKNPGSKMWLVSLGPRAAAGDDDDCAKGQLRARRD
jgi:electron transfer flavoprotein beta subunit